MRNLIRALRGKPVELSPKQEEKMARARAKADAQIAAAEARGREAEAEAARFMAGRGAAKDGASFSAPGAAAAPAQATPGQMPSVRDMLKQSFEGLRDSVGEMFDERSGIIDPGEGADLNRPPPELADPAGRAEVAAAERASRERARDPYRAPQAPEVTFTRFATTGRTQLDDVVEQLQASGLAARPELVFGVYRVPDRFDHGRNAEGRTFLEWEIAHAPGAHPPASDEVLTTAFRRDSHWVARRPGEPSVIDEDVAGTLAGRAGLQPEDCFGLTRLLQVRGVDQENGKSWRTHMEGALLLTRSLPALTRAHEQLMAEAPLALPSRPMLPFHVEILDWEAVMAWVAPDRWGPPRVPSPLPHLPSDWQELLLAYLELVGVRSEDCYGAQVTRTSERLLSDLSLASARKNFRSPPKVPSADGTERARMHAAEHVVIAYRDRAEYQAGRERWRAYQDDVLRAKLDHLSDLRPPIEVDLNLRQSFLSEVFDSFNPLDPMVGFPQVFNRNEKPSLGAYCGSFDG
jgi:hypothetical protein